MKTALLTAVGSASAGMVIERLHALGLRVVGCDIYPRAWNVASGEVDVFFQAVYATDADAYVRQMEEAVRREHADFLIPLTDVEVDALCAHKARFSALGCVLCVPDEPCAACAGTSRPWPRCWPARARAGSFPRVPPTAGSRRQRTIP